MKQVKILRKQIAPQAIKDEVLRTAIHCSGRILNEDGAQVGSLAGWEITDQNLNQYRK